MKVTLVQTHLFWEDREKNLKHFDELLKDIKVLTDLIILPEMFTTGFSMFPEKVAEEAEGHTLEWMKKKARDTGAIITGSVAVRQEQNYFNRLYWVLPNGEFHKYDKRHLFRMAKEDEHYKAGNNKIITAIREWNICPLVCYDLRFPVWSRNKFSARGTWDYDVLIYVANWPEVRSYPWKQLLVARAIENQCYVIGLNRVGNDGNGYAHSGDSMVINPRGEIISNIPPNQQTIEHVNLDRKYLEDYRKIFPLGLDVDKFDILHE